MLLLLLHFDVGFLDLFSLSLALSLSRLQALFIYFYSASRSLSVILNSNCKKQKSVMQWGLKIEDFFCFALFMFV
jgi:hypothetical protein